MNVVIAGGRDFAPADQDWQWLDHFHERHCINLVISGNATGADKFGEMWAGDHGVRVQRHPAEWNKHGKAAGPMRNRQMAKVADAVILFPGGRGTASMRKEAEKRNLPIYEPRENPARCGRRNDQAE